MIVNDDECRSLDTISCVTWRKLCVHDLLSPKLRIIQQIRWRFRTPSRRREWQLLVYPRERPRVCRARPLKDFILLTPSPASLCSFPVFHGWDPTWVIFQGPGAPSERSSLAAGSSPCSESNVDPIHGTFSTTWWVHSYASHIAMLICPCV